MKAIEAYQIAATMREEQEQDLYNECMDYIEEAANQGLFEVTMPYYISTSLSAQLIKEGYMVNAWTTGIDMNGPCCGSTRISWDRPAVEHEKAYKTL